MASEIFFSFVSTSIGPVQGCPTRFFNSSLRGRKKVSKSFTDRNDLPNAFCNFTTNSSPGCTTRADGLESSMRYIFSETIFISLGNGSFNRLRKQKICCADVLLPSVLAKNVLWQAA